MSLSPNYGDRQFDHIDADTRCAGCGCSFNAHATPELWTAEDSRGRQRCPACTLCPCCGDAELGLTPRYLDRGDINAYVCDECYGGLAVPSYPAMGEK